MSTRRLDKKGKRMVFMLIALALAFYVGFIVMTAVGR